jgi:hypothetical protein
LGNDGHQEVLLFLSLLSDVLVFLFSFSVLDVKSLGLLPLVLLDFINSELQLSCVLKLYDINFFHNVLLEVDVDFFNVTRKVCQFLIANA